MAKATYGPLIFFNPVALRGELALKVESAVYVYLGQSAIERSIPR